jgi:DNA-binding MarR family transcriptional regulator
MNFVADTLGAKLNTKAWENEKRLPFYFLNHYKFMKAYFDGEPCIIMKPKGDIANITALKKHIACVQEVEMLPVVLNLDCMTARLRKSLIKAKIPFTAPPCHIYLPFLGIALLDRYTSITRPTETLMPSSQLLLFYYLYQTKTELYTGETAGIFGISAMQVSRAVKQLSALGLVYGSKDGVRIFISSKERKRDLFEKVKPHLLNPVRKKLYLDYKELPAGLPLAGHSALAELTMLGKPLTEIYAFHGYTGDINGTEVLVDQNEQAEVEMWCYDPTMLSKHSGVVDVLSLVTSLLSDDDPRVERSIDELLSEVWR